MPSRLLVCAVAAVLSAASLVRADEERARAYLEAAKEDIKNGNPDSVERSLELMEEQFEGVSDAVKAQLKAEGEKVKKLAVEKKAEVLFVAAEKKLTELEKDKDLKRYLANAQAKPNDAEALRELGSYPQAYKLFTENELKSLPAGNPRTKAISDRLDQWAAPANKILLAGERQKNVDALKGVVDQLKGAAEQAKNDPAQPDFATWAQGSEEVPAKINLGIAAGVVEYLNNPDNKAAAAAFADDAEISGLFKQIKAAGDAAAARVVADLTKAVEAGETAPPNNWGVPTRMKQVRGKLEPLGTSGGADVLSARITKLLDKWEKGDAARAEGRTKAIDDLEASAKSTWPDVLAQYEKECVEIDPAEALADPGKFKGKLVKFDKPNAIGTQFGSNDFAYIATVDGKPFACKLNDKALAVTTKYRDWNEGRPLWASEFRAVVARVTGTGKVNVLSKNSVTDEYEVIGQADAPVAEIVAFQSRFVTWDATKGSNADNLK